MSKRLPSVIVGALLTVFAIGLSGDQTHSGHPSGTVDGNSRVTRCSAADPHDGSVAAAAGRKVFLDPLTGRITPTPPQRAAVPAPGVNDPLSTSGEGLQEVQGKTRGGGVKLHLQGRFRSTITARTDAEGHVTTRCRTESEPN